MMLTTVSKIKKVWSVAFVPRLLKGDKRCTPVSYAVLKKAHKSTSTSEDGEHDKNKTKNGPYYEYIFMPRKEPQLERHKNIYEEDNVTENVIEDNTSPIVSPPVQSKETQVERCQRLIERAFGNPKNKKQVTTDPYNIHLDKEDEPAKLKFEEESKSRTTQVEKCQRMIEKTLGRQKHEKHAVDEPYYCMDVDIEQTRREIREAQKAKLKYNGLVEKPLTDDRIHFGVYSKSRVESSKEDTLIPPLESQNITNEAATAKRGGTTDSATGTDRFEDLNLMHQTLNIYLTPGKGNDDNIRTRDLENTLQPEKTNLIRSNEKIDVANALSTIATTATTATKQNFMYYNNIDESLPLREYALKKDIDNYILKQEQMEDKLFCDMQHTYETSEEIYKHSESIMFEPHVKFSTEPLFEAKPRTELDAPALCKNMYSGNYWLEDIENDPETRKAEMTYRQNLEPHAQNENKRENLQWREHAIRENKTLQATTAKETEEQLTQKIEHIDETPLVEAHKPKIEGFNVTPRVLGDTQPSFNYSNDKRTNKQHTGGISRVDPNSYDEVAKRCLDTPTGKIDEILLKEMEKLGIPMTGKRDGSTHSPVIENALVQMDIVKKQHTKRSTVKDNLELESQGYERVTEKLLTKRQSVKCNEAKPDNNYEVINPNRKFIIHPEQVLIDPYDKKTIGKDTEEYDAQNFYDPTKRFAYFYIPEKNEGNYLLSKSNSPLNKKVNATPDRYNNVDVNDSPGRNQFDPTPELQETHRVYAKGTDKMPSSEAEKRATNSIWDEEQSNPSDSKYALHFTPTPVEKSPSFSPHKTCGTHNMWYGQQFNPQQQNYAHQNMARQTGGTPDSNEKHYLSEKAHMNYKKTHGGYSNNMGSAAHFYMPDGAWDKDSMQVYHNEAQINRTNINTSDGIWDEQSLEHHYVAPEQKIAKLNKKWNQDHVQSESHFVHNVPQTNPQAGPQWHHGDIAQHPWASNEAHPPTTCTQPKPQVLAVETSRFAEPESKYDEDHPDVYPEYHFSKPESEEKNYEEKMKKVTAFLHAEAFWDAARMNTIAANNMNMHHAAAGIPAANIPDTLNTLPKLDEAVSLTELLRRVRERSRIIECKNELKALGVEVDPVEGKCGGKAPRCSPMAPRSPPTNPIPPPTFGLPKLKPRPPVCKPRRKPRSNKCSSCEMDMSLGLRLGPQVAQAPIVCQEMVCEMNVAGALDISLSRSRIDLTDDIIDRLQALGKILGVVLRQSKTDVLECAVVKHRRDPKVVLARDYEPWAPIPSWPKPKKAKRKESPCTPGCKIFPPTRAQSDPPCDPETCRGFPKKSFAVLDCFAVSLGDNKVYDLVKNQDSPVLSRSFFKTEWTKPKFDVTKPYSINRENTDDLKNDGCEENIPLPRKKSKKAVVKQGIVKCNTISPKPSKCCHVEKLAPLNLERLLVPPMASVSYVISRNYATETEDNETKDAFWRPKARIPSNPEEWREKMQNPKLRKEFENEARYLLLSFDERTQQKKNLGAKKSPKQRTT